MTRDSAAAHGPPARAAPRASLGAWLGDPRRERWTIAGLVLLGFGLRLTFVIQMQDNPYHHEPDMDSAYHVRWARAIVSGEGFAPLADRPFFRAPLYVWFLAACLWLFGDSLLAPRLVQCALGAATVGLVYAIGRRAFDARVAVLAAAIAATYWVLIYFDGELLIPALAVPLDLLALWLTLGLASAAGGGRAALSGLVWGVSALARPNVLLFMPCLALWLLWRCRPRWTRGLVPAALFSAGLLAPILPVTAYNTFVKGDFVLISSQAGVNLWIGNNPYSDGVTAIVPATRAGWGEGSDDSIAQAEQAEGRPLKSSEVSSHYARRAWRFLVDEPEKSLPLLARKLKLFWTGWEYSNNHDITYFSHRYSGLPRLSIGFAVLASLGLLGAFLSLRESRHFPLWGFLGVYTLSVVAFFICSRFRVPVLPVLMVFAGHALVWLWESAIAGRWARLGAGLGFALAFGLWSSAQAPTTGIGSNGRNQLASIEARYGRFDEAAELLQEALLIEPAHINALVKLGWVHRMRGEHAESIRVFHRAMMLNPLRTDAVDGLLDSLVTSGRLDDAELWIGRYLSQLQRMGVSTQPEIPFYHLGRLRAARGQSQSARAAYRAALQRDPRSLRALRALGDLEREAGELASAIALYRRGIALLPSRDEPEDGALYPGLVVALSRSGQRDAACREAAAWAARRPSLAAPQRALRSHCDAGGD